MNKPITKKEWMEYLEKTWDAAQEEALAQPEQEPVAWAMLMPVEGDFIDAITPDEHARVEGEYKHPLYTTPPQRTWVGLTDEERAVIVEAHTTDDHGYDIWCDGDGVARAIEAKLKEKNT